MLKLIITALPGWNFLIKVKDLIMNSTGCDCVMTTFVADSHITDFLIFLFPTIIQSALQMDICELYSSSEGGTRC